MRLIMFDSIQSIVEQREIVKKEQEKLDYMEEMLANAVIGRLYSAYYADGRLAHVGELESIDINSYWPYKFTGAGGGAWDDIEPYIPIEGI